MLDKIKKNKTTLQSLLVILVLVVCIFILEQIYYVVYKIPEENIIQEIMVEEDKSIGDITHEMVTLYFRGKPEYRVRGTFVEEDTLYVDISLTYDIKNISKKLEEELIRLYVDMKDNVKNGKHPNVELYLVDVDNIERVLMIIKDDQVEYNAFKKIKVPAYWDEEGFSIQL